MEEKLLVVFQNINEWLRFAEAKNAMIIALNGVVVFGVAQIIEFNFIKDIEILKWYLTIAFICLTFSTIVALLSFIPRLKQIAPTFNLNPGKDNFLFFDTLKDKKINEVIEFYKTDDEVQPYHEQLADQIIVNSGIAKRKYDYFTFSCWITIAGIITPLIAGLFAFFIYKK
ncbi:hypothetical protein C1T31_10115 [Hanstruepera neustonica]|uniref:Pycsar effector protein domain-containing protein n=1 Tax=Hanstruepera neustonica TaxID=1445657 RepID=A0A2K1DXW1_9FLAO|nr:Pycsar system effector family protein [Hanstruepera neustonica]PNQ72850.1 hypothetical protein C1T31_10115 [Hanstruepera neustonica]